MYDHAAGSERFSTKAVPYILVNVKSGEFFWLRDKHEGRPQKFTVSVDAYILVNFFVVNEPRLKKKDEKTRFSLIFPMVS
jgi:hypothetical protein